jgi:hypothetical protein
MIRSVTRSVIHLGVDRFSQVGLVVLRRPGWVGGVFSFMVWGAI